MTTYIDNRAASGAEAMSQIKLPEPTEAQKLLPHEYLLAKLAMVMPLFQEARDALPAISLVSAKLHRVRLDLGDRMDVAGTFSLDDWREHFPEQAAEAAVRLNQEGTESWKEEVIDACVVNWVEWDETNPRKTIAALIQQNIAFALDPSISRDAQALIERGRASNQEAPSEGAEPNRGAIGKLVYEAFDERFHDMKTYQKARAWEREPSDVKEIYRALGDKIVEKLARAALGRTPSTAQGDET